MQESKKTPPLFISGTQRSGTTLLHQIISASSQVWSQNEVYPLHRPMFAAPSAKHDRQFAAAMCEFFEVSLPPGNQPLLRKQKLTYFDDAMAAKAEQNNKCRWCLKDPQTTYYLNEYADAFPTANFLILIRDPRAVCRSYLDPRGFTVGRPTNWIVAAERWKNEVTTQLAFAKENPDKVLLVHYESLVSDLPNTIKKVCDKTDIKLEESMLSYYQQEAAVSLHDGNENITRPPDASKANSWRSQLASSAIATIEAITRPIMHELGYDASQAVTEIPFGRVTYARFCHAVISEYRWQRFKLTEKSQ
ncbi:sulfotransferase [bacterium]|nr:sulfotransferase [bacterium]